MKKVLALVLAVLMVTSCMLFTTVAAEDAADAGFEIIPVTDCDDLTADGWWQKGELTTTNFVQGTGAISQSVEGRQSADTIGAFAFYFDVEGTLDVSEMTTLVFDFYTSDASAMTGLTWDFMLYDENNSDRYRTWFKGLTMDEIMGTPIKDGWNHGEVSLAAMTNKGWYGAADLTKFNAIRFYCNENDGGARTDVTEYGVENGVLTLAVDNIYFANQAQGNLDALKIGITPYENQTSYNGLVYDTAHNNASATRKGFNTATKLWNSYGSGILWGEHDLTPYDTLECDIYIDNVYANDIYYTLAFGFNVPDYYQWAARIESKKLSDIAGKQLSVGWNHVEIDLSDFNNYVVEKSANWTSNFIDWAKVCFFSFFNDPTKATDTEKAVTTTATIKVKNLFCTTQNPTIVEGTGLYGHGVLTSGVAQNNVLGRTWLSNYKYQSDPEMRYPTISFGDVTGDGDKECYILNATAAGSHTYVKRGVNAAIAYSVNKDTATLDFSRVTDVQVDLYAKFDGQIKTDQVIYLEFETANLSVLGDAGNHDLKTGEASFALVPSQGTALKDADGNATGWYRVTLPIEDFGAGFDMSSLARIEIQTADVSWTSDAIVAVDNINFVVTPETKVTSSATINGANLVLTEDFGVIYNATLSNILAPYVEFEFNGETTKVQGVDAGDGKYTFAFDGIMAHQMTDTINATLYGVDVNGIMVSMSFPEYSIEKYCTNMLSSTSSDALTTLLYTVLNYGAQTQLYADYKTDALATVNAPNAVDYEWYDWASNYDVEIASVLEGTYTEGAKWRSATLVLDNAVAIRYTFTADSVDGLTVNVNKGGNTAQVTSFNEGDGYYYFDVPVYATEYNEVVTVDFGGDYKVNYSVNHYLLKYEEVNDGTNLADLLNAIFCYGLAAREYTGLASYPFA